MITYSFLQAYWWFLIALLGGLLTFLFFVQGGNSLLFVLGKTKEQQRLLTSFTSQKWEWTFTCLVTFGGAFFASFPLFYSTSFGGAYWVWVLLLLSFVLQGVSYEFSNKPGNLLGRKTYQCFLIFNGFIAPFGLGAVVSTFFNGAEFVVNKEQLSLLSNPTISHWANPLHGLEVFLNPWNLLLGFAVFFLARVLGLLYFRHELKSATEVQSYSTRRCIGSDLGERVSVQLRRDFSTFLLFFLSWLIHTLLQAGFAVNELGVVYLQEYKYALNLWEMPIVLIPLLVGIIGVLYGGIMAICKPAYRNGIWFCAPGAVVTVLSIILIAGYNHTAYYPSVVDLQSSLTLENSCSSEFTLRVMAVVSLLIPFVLAYIAKVWYAMDKTISK